MAETLLLVLFTKPPRKWYVRVAMGVMAVVLVGWGVALMLQGSYKLLDMVLFIELGIAFGLATLEVTEPDATRAAGANTSKHRHAAV
jgi:hypothetical protein